MACLIFIIAALKNHSVNYRFENSSVFTTLKAARASVNIMRSTQKKNRLVEKQLRNSLFKLSWVYICDGAEARQSFLTDPVLHWLPLGARKILIVELINYHDDGAD